MKKKHHHKYNKTKQKMNKKKNGCKMIIIRANKQLGSAHANYLIIEKSQEAKNLLAA